MGYMFSITLIAFLVVGCQNNVGSVDQDVKVLSDSIQNATLSRPIDLQGVIFSNIELDSLRLNFIPDSMQVFNLESKKFVQISSNNVLSSEDFDLLEYRFELYGGGITFVTYELMNSGHEGLLYEEEINANFDNYKSYFDYCGTKTYVSDLTSGDDGVLNWFLDYIIAVDNTSYLIGFHKQCDACSEFEIRNYLINC